MGSRVARFFVSRVPVFLTVLVVGATLMIGTSVRGSLTHAWDLFHLPITEPGFIDAFFLTGAVGYAAGGGNPYITGVWDRYHRPFNYPPIWLQLRHLGVARNSYPFLGFCLIAILVATVLRLFRCRTWQSGLLATAAVMSYPVLFAAERANIDILVLGILVLGIALIQRLPDQRRPFARGALVFCLTVLKLYPVAISGLFLRHRKHWLAAAALAIVSLVALYLSADHQLFRMLANTPQDDEWSFGSYAIVAIGVMHFVYPDYVPPHYVHTLTTGVALLVELAAAGLGVRYRARLAPYLPQFDMETEFGSLNAASLLIFCFVFAAGSNFCYRLIFLLVPIAYLLRRMDDLDDWRPALPAMAFIALMVSYYLTYRLPQVVFQLAAFLIAGAWIGVAILAPALTESEPCPEAPAAPALTA